MEYNSTEYNSTEYNSIKYDSTEYTSIEYDVHDICFHGASIVYPQQNNCSEQMFCYYNILSSAGCQPLFSPDSIILLFSLRVYGCLAHLCGVKRLRIAVGKPETGMDLISVRHRNKGSVPGIQRQKMFRRKRFSLLYILITDKSHAVLAGGIAFHI